jgi:site-specific recombinase XerD
MATNSTTQSFDADLLSRGEAERLISAASGRAPTGIRNRAIIALAWRSELRIGEVLSLRLKDVDCSAGTVVIQRGKGGKRRVVGIDSGAAALVQNWLEARARLQLPRSSPLFCTLRGEVIDQSYVRHLLPRLASRAGIDKRVHAHGLRHAFAVELEAEGAPLTTIRDLLGHSSAAATDRYLRRIGASDAVDFPRRRTWAGGTAAEG